MAVSWKQKLLGATVVSSVVVGTVAGCLALFSSAPRITPVNTGITAKINGGAILERECGTDQTKPGYGDCLLRTLEKIGRAENIANGKPEYDDDEFGYGAHTAMGREFDMTRDGLYVMARSAGNAAHCNIITQAQADAIVSEATTSRLNLRGDEFLQMQAEIDKRQQEGFRDSDCSHWASPRAVAIEKNLAATSTIK